jgi:hypothetical protein
VQRCGITFRVSEAEIIVGESVRESSGASSSAAASSVARASSSASSAASGCPATAWIIASVSGPSWSSGL